MNVAAFVDQRKDEIEAFSSILFRKRTATGKKGTKRPRSVEARGGEASPARRRQWRVGPSPPPPSTSTAPIYRRPASPNTPLSTTVRLVKDTEKRKRRRASGNEDGVLSRLYSDYYDPTPAPAVPTTAAAASFSSLDKSRTARLAKAKVRQRHQRPLVPEAWRRFRKRRRQLLRRRRPTAVRRRHRRALDLRYGKGQPSCACCRGPAKGRGRRIGASRTQPLWLPSHRYTCKGFSFSHHIIRLRGPSALTAHVGHRYHPSPVVLATPLTANRKRHRCLQRWVSHLRDTQTGGRRRGANKKRGRGPDQHGTTPAAEQQALACKHHQQCASTLPPQTLLADQSHACVYEIGARDGASLLPSVHPPSSIDDAFRTWLTDALGVRLHEGQTVRGCYSASFSDARSSKATVEHNTVRALHGHAWSADGKRYDTSGVARVGVSVRLPHTVPVTAVYQPARNDRKATEPDRVWLIAEAPMHFPTRALQRCSVRLVSLWTPCASPVQSCFASVFEIWRAERRGGTDDDVPGSVTGATAAAKLALKVLTEAATQLRTVPKRKPQTTAAAGNQVKSGRPAAYRLVAYPTLAANPMALALGTGPAVLSISEHCVWSLLLVSDTKATPATATATARPRNNAPRRREHFWVARLFFNNLRRGLAAASRETTARQPRSYRAGCRTIGAEDRATLLHLLGRAVYTTDYRPHNPAESSTTSGSIRRWGTRDNAPCRLLVRPTALGSGGGPSAPKIKLPAQHATPGTVLLHILVESSSSRDDTGARFTARTVGLVTSPAFFSQPIGGVVAPVWALAPPPPGHVDWPAVVRSLSLLPGQSHCFLLAHQQVADELCTSASVSNGLLRAEKRQRCERRTFERLQRLMCDPLSCTVVEPLFMFS